jgi:hypothetical protein
MTASGSARRGIFFATTRSTIAAEASAAKIAVDP